MKKHLQARNLFAAFVVSNEDVGLVNEGKAAEKGGLDGEVRHERLPQLPLQLITQLDIVDLPVLFCHLSIPALLFARATNLAKAVEL